MTNHSEPAAENPGMTRPSRMALYVVAALLATWMIGLAGLTQVPFKVIVNQRQIRRADVLITGVVEDRTKKLVRVDKVWFGRAPETNPIKVANLDQVVTRDGQPYLFPLWNDGRIVKVSKERVPDSGGPVVYSDNEEMRDQIVDALERGRIRE